MIRFRIVINCGPCENFIARCIGSVVEQSFHNWDAWVTIDPCGDGTFDNAVAAAGRESRVHLVRNEVRRYSLGNLVAAIESSEAEPEDVIVVLDGDDWFATPDALRIVADAYRRFDCWMTYGSWISNVAGPHGRYDGRWPAYPEGTSDFRRSRWLGTAVRTWKKWLWDLIDHADLRGHSGEYFRVAEDQAVMLPLLEMSGTTKARHISEIIMVYNKTVKYPVSDAIEQERERIALLLDQRASYPRLQARTACSG